MMFFAPGIRLKYITMKSIYSFLILALAVFISSCEDFLEEGNPPTAIAVDYIYSTPDGFEVGVNALYNLQRSNNFPSGYGDQLWSNVFFYAGTDLALARAWNISYDGRFNALNFPGYKWERSYQVIDRANALIDAAPGIVMNEDEKNQLLAQAKVIRGELYFDLIRMYNNILLDTIPTTPENAFDSVTFAVADPSDVYDLIDSDLDFAIEHLDWDVPSGRYGQGVARHIRGKSAMWQGDWAEAAAQFDAIVESGAHQLVPSPQGVFSGDRNHTESLLTYQFDLEAGGSADLAGGEWHIFPGLFNNRSYEMIGLRVRDVDNGGQALGWYYPNDYLLSLYDRVNDRRFNAYYYPIELIINDPDNPRFGQLFEPGDYSVNYREYHWSLRKYHDPEKPLLSDRSYSNVIYYRYAEVLLLGAEAHWRLSDRNSADPTAIDYMNRVIERAYGNPSQNITSFTLETYLEESARELAFEKNRWFLLKRTGKLLEQVNAYHTTGSNAGNRVLNPMSAHMTRLPIPQAQIDLMGTFPQNAGY